MTEGEMVAAAKAATDQYRDTIRQIVADRVATVLVEQLLARGNVNPVIDILKRFSWDDCN